MTDTPKHHDGILILDYGSQFTQLIARRVREAHVYCEIHPPTRSLEWIKAWKPKGIILSGGPNSVYDDGAPIAPTELLDLGVPMLGLCYGMQLIAHLAGGKVVRADRREYGRAVLTVEGGPALPGLPPGRGDPGLDEPRRPRRHARRRASYVTASSANSPVAGFEHTSQADLRGAVPSRGGAHGARRRDHRATFSSTSAAASRTGPPGTSSRPRSRRSASWSAPPRGHLRTLRRRRLLGRGGAGAPRGRRPAHLHLRRSRAAPAPRARPGRAHLPPPPGHRPPGGGRQRPVPGEPGRRQRSGGEAPTIIGHTFIDVFEAEAAQGGQGRRVPGAGHALSRRDRVHLRRGADRRSPSRPTTTSVACPSGFRSS